MGKGMGIPAKGQVMIQLSTRVLVGMRGPFGFFSAQTGISWRVKWFFREY